MAWRAAIEPIETWSSWLAEVGIESALAGWARTLFSDASAAAVYWSSIMPDSRPLPGREERRQPAVQARVDHQRDPPLRDGAQLGDGQLGEVQGEGHGLAVEVAAADDQPAAGGRGGRVGHAARREDERVVGGRVQLDVEDAAQIVERVANGAVDLGHAAERVRVLDLVGRGVVAGHERRVAQQPAQFGGDGDLAGMRPGQLVGGRVGHVRAQQRLAAHRRGHARRCARGGGRRRPRARRSRSSSASR